MHRHSYKGRKLSRKRDQRRALIKGLASNLAVNETIVTTHPKAKELVPYFEKLITKAKKGDLHNRRQVIAKMANTDSANKLVDEIAPKLISRHSGYLRVTYNSNRRGDNAKLSKVSFVDNLKSEKVASTAKEEVKETKKAPAKASKSSAVKSKVISK